MQHKVRLLASSALLFAAALGTSAQAQVKSAVTAAAAAGASNTIEELVVTAEKRAQSLQDVPVAISAFTSTTRDLIGINSIQDMTNFTPGLNYSSANDRNSIRGLARLTNSHPIANSVALYDDGVYSSSTVPAGKTPIFSDRVEVLRGPQGTLYGRNSIGGAINVISRRPTEDPYAEVRATVANYGRTLLEAAVSGPLAPNLQYRLAGNWEKQRDGYFTNVVPGMPSEGNVIDQYNLEAQLQGKAGDHFDFWGKMDIVGWNNGGGGPGARSGYSPGPFNYGEFGASSVAAGFACAPGGVVSNVVNTSPLGCTNPAASDPRKFASNYAQSVALDDTYNGSVNFTYHFPIFDLKYIAGGSNYHYTLQTDNGGGSITSFTINPAATINPLLPVNTSTQPCPIVNTLVAPGGCAGLKVFPTNIQTYEENFHNFSHEINIASTGDGALQWLGGLYYYMEGIVQPVFQTLPQQTQLATMTPVNSVGASNSLALQNRIFDDRPNVQDRSYAVFGQLDWKFAQDWKATLGLRWSHDHEYGTETLRSVCFATTACASTPQLFGSFSFPLDVTHSITFQGPGTPVDVVPNATNTAGGFTFSPDGSATRSYDVSSEATTGTLNLQWTPDKDTTAYASYSRGYKQAGIFVGAGSTGGNFPGTGAEHLNDYEIGLKKDFGHTLQTNIAAFYYDYLDFQAPLTVTSTSGALSVNQSLFLNVPKSYSYGVEFESTWAPIDNLKILFNYSWNPTGIRSLTNIVDPQDPEALQKGATPINPVLQTCTGSGTPTAANPGLNPLCDVNTGLVQRPQNMKGNTLPSQPENKVAINVLYTFDFAPGSLSPSVSYVWRDKEYASIFKREYDSSPSWSQVDARVTWKDKDNKYSIIAYVKNLFDDLGYDAASSATLNRGVYPLATVAASGGAITPGLASVPGLTVNGVATGFGPGGLTRNYLLTPPRTFGVEFQYRF
ncbi:TonB-dependent receptor [Phenylobacterium sp.]|uniref:TonB-dependent receptor n=1 Tax=Phenylobacterium sp. TaxID=1871053 RepID=UPI002E36B0F6|nr:TonB-dependent receptor [Phenylobacterium sp.]HEX3365424.1 TonB-dependent receptor [Phenylobacterium sp.]